MFLQYPLALLPLLSFAAAEPTVYPGSNDYIYKGCYNETANLPDSPGTRALSPGTSQVSPDEMTPEKCLAYCASESYAYAGLEYSRECWCSHFLSDMSAELDNKECDLPCDGDPEYICGGSWTLSVYELQSASPTLNPTRALFLLAVGAAAVLAPH